MSNSRLYRTTALALSMAVTLSAAPAVLAQTTQSTTTTAATPSDTTQVVITGQRASRRSRLDTLAPVDVVTAQSLSAQGNTELAQGLSRTVPSLNFPRPSGTDATDNIRPAQLRGLSPDETLVLVDGKRWHASSLVNINGSAGRGSAAVDLNAIPEAALDRVEVLRDGASAQYGSDAIAGVLNLHLREANHGGNIEASVGEYDTDVQAANSSRHEHDGETTDLNGWIGLPLGSDGFVTVSGDVKKRDATSRGDVDLTVTPNVVTSRYGDPEQSIASVFVNAGKPINNDWSVYGNASYTDNDSKSAAFFRHANSSGNVASIYPNGFLPIENFKSKDYSATFGVKGEAWGWTQDYSITYGGNDIDYFTLNSVNPTYGAASQTSFYDGETKYDQTVFNADLSRPFDVGLHTPLTVAVGLEARHETYQIDAGDLESYAAGPLASGSVSPGAQGFGGFEPSNAVDKSRDSAGVYIDAAANITDKLSFDTALRYENYSDFGSNITGKIAARYDFTPNFAIRGNVDTGFRAPSLQQQYFTSTASNLITTTTPASIVQTGTFPSNSPLAEALGGQPLKAEKSTSQSLGAVWHKGPFELTVDGYHIRIANRIVLSENLLASSSPQLAALLAPYGVSAARFFLNGVTTDTSGVDVVGNYRIPTDNLGRFNLSVAWNNNNTVIDKEPTDNALSSITPAPVLFARIRQYILTGSSPENKGTFAVDWNRSGWSATARATYYESVIDPGSTPASDIRTGDKTIVDLEGSYSFSEGTRLTVGVDNLFDTYPDKVPANLNVTSGNGAGALAFDRFSPFGFDGRYIYAKVSQSF